MTKTAIVTGGSRGIGAATSSLLAANGYNVIINYNASADAAIALKADIVSKGFNAEVYKCDVSDSDEVNSMPVLPGKSCLPTLPTVTGHGCYRLILPARSTAAVPLQNI